jgi:hypothetical protein
MASVVLADAEVPVDVAAWHDNTHDDDNSDGDNSDGDNSDARFDMHAHDGVLVDEAHPAATVDGVVRADVVVAGRMHKCLLADKKMRICIVSYHRWCKSHSSIM